MILIKYLNFIYKYITNNFNICIMRTPMGIFINTTILNFLIHFYNKRNFYIISEEKQGSSFIQKGCPCHTILKKDDDLMKKNHKKKAIIVARTATKNPKSGLTLNSQFSWAKQKAKELDAVIVNTFSFNGMSANSFFEEYAEQILSTICQQKIDYLIVYQFNRLTRDLSKGLNIFRKTIKLGCAIVTSSETFDETSDIFKHIEQAIAFDEGILKLPCKRCDSFMMKKNGREVNEGFVVQRFNCKECDYRFHVPSHKQLNHEGYHE